MKATRTIRRTSSMRLVVSVSILVAGAATVFQPGPALGVRGGQPRAVRLEGYWDHGKSEHAIIGEVTISADAHPGRQFGITAAQAYKPPEEGPQIFRHSSLRPVTLLLKGRQEMIDRFMSARPDQKVTALGVYRAGPGQFILSSVDVAGALDATPAPAK